MKEARLTFLHPSTSKPLQRPRIRGNNEPAEGINLLLKALEAHGPKEGSGTFGAVVPRRSTSPLFPAPAQTSQAPVIRELPQPFFYRSRFPNLIDLLKVGPRTPFCPLPNINPPLVPQVIPLIKNEPGVPASREPLPNVKAGSSESEGQDNSDSSLEENDVKLSVNAYKRRNVYKSIIRHMYSYIRKNRASIITVLERNGFKKQDIEHAFFKISYLNDLEKQKGKTKKSQTTVKEILKKKTIYTCILRETLYAMMQNWQLGKTGKISQENLYIYKEVCENYYKKTVELLGQPAQGTSYQL